MADTSTAIARPDRFTKQVRSRFCDRNPNHLLPEEAMAHLDPDGPSLDSIIEAYIRLGMEGKDDDFWGWEEFKDILSGDSEAAWAALLELVARAPDELFDYIGAGPVEDLVVWRPDEFVVRMAEQAKLDPRFKEALSYIWLGEGKMPREMEQILQEATDHRIYIVPKRRE